MRTIPWILALFACNYEAPLNPYVEPPAAVITGTIVADVPEASDVIVLAFDAANPGPPVGTGRPVTFTTVPAGAFTPDAASGLKSAPFSLTDLPLGGAGSRDFQIQALLDADQDFNPLFTALAGATCGDVGGAYITDLTTQAFATVTATEGQLVPGISVLVAQPFTSERPAFTSEDPTLSKKKGVASVFVSGAPNLANIQFYRLNATSVHTDYSESPLVGTRSADGLAPMPLDLDGPCTLVDATACAANAVDCGCDPAASSPCDTAFTVYMVDADGDGEVDPYPADIQAANGIKDVWPRVFLQYAGDPVKVDGAITNYTEIDLDPENNALAPPSSDYPYPELWVAESFPFAYETSGIAGPLPAELAPYVGVPFQSSSLSMLWSPVFRHYWKGGTFDQDANGTYDLVDLRCSDVGVPYEWCSGKADPAVVPEGLWQINVIEPNGQTWSLPNEISWLKLPSTGSDDFDPQAQGIALTIGE